MADPAPIRRETKGKQRDQLLQQCLLWLRMLSLTSAVCPQQNFPFFLVEKGVLLFVLLITMFCYCSPSIIAKNFSLLHFWFK